MANDDAKIKATVVLKLHHDGRYDPRAVPVEAAASWGVASHNRGRAKELVDEMARDESSPVIYKIIGETVMLEHDRGKVAAWIRRHGGDDAVPWDLEDEL